MNQPKLYTKYNDLQKKDNIYVLENYLQLIKWKNKKVKIVDIGCGDGYITSEFLMPKLPAAFEKLVGCDISEKMVKYANENRKHPKVEFLQFNIAGENIPEVFKNNFDHLFSFYCLHWVQKQRQAFQNMFDMLKPGGDMLVTFLASNPIFDGYENISKSKKWAPYPKDEFISPYHHSPKPKEEMENLLKDVGFETNLCKVEKRSYVFRNCEILRKSITAVNPVIHKLQTDEINSYVEDLITELRKLKTVKFEPYDNNNEERIQVHYSLFIIHATRPKA